MNSYPEVVAKIANDYLERVKSQLRLVPIREKNEFLAEIESHLYEAYQQRPEADDVARILAVLRNLGEPAEVVSDRLPRTMARSGTKRNLPLYVVGGILIALFGIPLGFGGLGVLVGILAALAGMVVAFYATVGSIVLVGALFMLLGLTRMLLPQLFDRLVMLGFVHISAPTADFLDHFSRSEQNLLMILFGSVWLASGLGMLWVGRYLFRGLRFLFGLLFDRMRRFAQGVRPNLRPKNREAAHVSQVSLAKGDK
jgi:uncharacterized membrane protein